MNAKEILEGGIDSICTGMLDNADMRLDLSNYPEIRMQFLVHGTIGGKYWEVEFLCTRGVHFSLEHDADIDKDDLHPVFEVRVVSPESSQETGGEWTIAVEGHARVNVRCEDFLWSVKELSLEEHELQSQ